MSASIPNPVRSAFTTHERDDTVIVSIGPSHPATHGTVQIIAELDGEKVLRTDVHCGYLHRGFEKECEDHTWHNLIPYVDRLNYCSALINDFAYCDAVEQMMGIEITPRTKYLRTLLSEYMRITDHLTCVAASLMELGAMTAFLYLVTVRDYMYEHLAALTGARVTYSYGRIGGLANDVPDGWFTRLHEILAEYEPYIERVHGLVDRKLFRSGNSGVLDRSHRTRKSILGACLVYRAARRGTAAQTGVAAQDGHACRQGKTRQRDRTLAHAEIAHHLYRRRHYKLGA